MYKLLKMISIFIFSIIMLLVPALLTISIIYNWNSYLFGLLIIAAYFELHVLNILLADFLEGK